MKFVSSPNLPDHRVKAVLLSSATSKELIKLLYEYGIEGIPVPPCNDISPQVAAHPDMLFHHLGGNKIVCYKAADQQICRQLALLGFELIKSDMVLLPQYPNDIALNAARIGKFLFCREKYTDKNILEYCRKRKIHIISVNQGYSKCSVCVVNKNAIITADPSIAKAADTNGLQVLMIEAGHIDLPGYDSGFIGGCCGKISKSQLLFHGDITKHPDYLVIKSFLNRNGIEIISTKHSGLFDIGSIIPLTEYD